MALGSYAASQLNVVGERQIPTTNMFNFQQKQQVEDKIISSDEARQLFTGKPPEERKMIYEKLKSGGFSFEDEITTTQPTPTPTPTPAPQTGGFGQGIQNISAGIASGASQAVGGTLGIVGDFLSAPFSENVSLGGIFTGTNTGGLGQITREETARQQAEGARAFGAETESMGYKGGKFGTGLGLAIATPGGVLGAAGKGTQFGKSLAQYGSIAQGLGKGVDTASKLATSKVGLGAAQGAIETGKFMGLTEGRLGTPTELATGAAFGAALPVAGAAFGKARDYVTTKLPKSLVATGISTPTEYVKTSERLNKLGIEEFQDATSTGKWLLQNKIAGDLEKRTAQLNALAEKSKQTTKKLLKSNITPVSDDIVGQMKSGLEGLREKLAAAKLTKYTNMIDDWANKKVWSAEDLNSARTFLADKGKIFKQSGDWVDDLQKENLQDIWLSASQYLDNAIPGFRAGNKDYEVASALAEAIKLKTGQDQVRQVFNLVNVASAGLGGALGGLTGNDPMSILQGAALGLTGRAIFSPSNMSKLAVKLSEYAPKAEATKATKAIELFVKSRGENPLPQSVMNLIAKANKKLGDPFKDISFIKKMQKGEVQGLSKEALDAMQGVKTVKEAMQKAKSAGVEDEIRRVYPLEGSRFDLSKNKKGFLQVGKVDEAEAKLMEEARKYKSAEEFVKNKITPPKNKIYLYRGLGQKFDPKFDLSRTDAPNGYSTWTDKLELAEQYAGKNGFVYKIELPKNKLGKEIIDSEGERTLYFNNEKKAGLNNISGDEYLIYNFHDDYNPNLIKQTEKLKQLKDIYNQATK